MYIEGVPVLTNVRVFTGSGNTEFTNEAAIIVNKSSGAATTVTLPEMTGVTLKSMLWVIDGKGDSYTNNITVDGSGAETINGAANYVLAKNYGGVGLMWNGTEWNIHSDSGTLNVIDFTGATGVNEIHVPTNLADALSIEDSAGDLMKFDTTTGSQRITVTPAVTVTGAVTLASAIIFSGATGVPEVRLTTNLADALSIEDTAGDLVVFDTTTGSQRITVTPATTVTGAVTLASAIIFSGATGVPEIRLTTNLADALSIEDTAGDLVKFDTTTGTQVITVTPAVTISGEVTMARALIFSGTTGIPEIRLTTNLADALSIEDGAGDLVVFDTTTGAQVITVTPTFKQGSVAADLAGVKGTYISGTVAVTVPSITDPDIAKVDVDTSAMTFACAIGDAVIVMPSEALPTNCRLLGAWVTGADTVQVTFGSEGGNVTGAAKNMKFLFYDLT